jgi:outer membrane protein insertion porin family
MDHLLYSKIKNLPCRELAPGLVGRSFLTAILTVVLSTGCQLSRFGQLDLPVPPKQLIHDPFSSEPVSTVSGDWHQSVQADWQQNPIGAEPLDYETPANGYADHSQSQHLVRYQSPDTDSSKKVRSLLAIGNKNSETAAASAPPPSLDKLSISDLNEANVAPADSTQLVKEVVIKGNRRLPTHHLTRNMGTRAGRYFDPDRLQEDTDRLWRIQDISRVNGPYVEQTPEGVIITIEIFERNVINAIKFIGNRGFTDRKLLKESGLEVGGPIDVYQVRSAKTRIEELYKSKGYPRTQVEVLEGGENEDAEVVFLIHEDQKQRIWKAEFEGNQIATDARLRSFIESKPGYLKLIGGLVKRDDIDNDIQRLTNYYRSLGFFNARIGREIQESNDGRWLTIRFIINEGPRYKVRNVAFMGNHIYESDQLQKLVKLKPEENEEPAFNSAKMNADVVALRDLYGGQGYVFANVEAEPRFLEEPGMLDIVYKISEGKQYRAGDINVHFEGSAGVTRREVVMNRLSIRPGDIIDVREIRNSERRLGAAQIFADPSTGSSGPKIVLRPPELKDIERHARSESSFH